MVREGYKQTEVGVIPEDWDVKEIQRIGHVIRGASPRPKGDPRYYGGTVPRLMVKDVTRDGKFVTPKIDFLTEAGRLLSRPCPKGTLTIVCSGTVGVPSFLAIDACIHDGFLAITNISKEINQDYLYHYINTQRDRLDSSSTHGGVFTNLKTEILREFKLVLPADESEQKAIASALSDVDRLIASLEALIAKKRALKTATMQQLLTGKTRLDGFGAGKGMKQTELGEIPEDWDLTSYDEVFDFLPTASNSRADLGKDREIAYIHYGDIHTRLHTSIALEATNLPSIDIKKITLKNRILNGDVIMADASEDYTGIGKSIEIQSNETIEAISGLHTFHLRDTNAIYADGFRGYLHQIPSVKKQMDRLATGLKVFGVSKGNLKLVKIPLPTKAEQREITNCLSKIESDIQSTVARLAKTKALKQGMMQELLTGRTRLV